MNETEKQSLRYLNFYMGSIFPIGFAGLFNQSEMDEVIWHDKDGVRAEVVMLPNEDEISGLSFLLPYMDLNKKYEDPITKFVDDA
ncbi:MAG: hypothetical protein CL885_00830 [Dehalococcoidia bacterium]|nr:hypothetical protein [Dehalococcoidia bacterium]|tara:strand:+ start:106 stop:360 length:255 start_codon:yes stop_codon:yes gene_type:complete